MSAYMVEKDHIVYLVEAAISHRLSEGNGGSISWRGTSGSRELGPYTELRCTATNKEKVAVGNMLWKANERSIRARYPDRKTAADMPGKHSDAEILYRLTESDFARRITDIDPVQVLKSIACFEYQTCEFSEWEESEAFSFCRSLRCKAIHALPGYDEAKWGAPKTT